MRTAHSKKAADEPHVGILQACGSRGFVPARARGNPGRPVRLKPRKLPLPCLSLRPAGVPL